MCVDRRSRPLLMTSVQNDFTALVFPLVLAAASIGEGALRRSAIPPYSHMISLFSCPVIFSRRASQGHIPRIKIRLFSKCLTLHYIPIIAIGESCGHSCRWSPVLCNRAGLSTRADSFNLETERGPSSNVPQLQHRPGFHFIQ